MRAFFFVLGLLCSIHSFAAELVAPLPLILGPAPRVDMRPVTVTNGETTFVAWLNEFSPHISTGEIYVRVLESPAPGVKVGGSHAAVATDGTGYLVATSWLGSPFVPSSPVINVEVQLFSSDGEPGPQKVLNRSLAASVGGAEWDGRYWIVSYTSDGRALVAMLDHDLEVVATVDLGEGQAFKVVLIERTLWAFVSREDVVEGLEILPAAAIGRRHSIVAAHLRKVIPTSSGALLLRDSGAGVGAVAFDPEEGFGAEMIVAAEHRLHDATSWMDGAAVLVSDMAVSASSIVALDREGDVVGTTLLNPELGPAPSIRIGQSSGGLLYFETRQTGPYYLDRDLFAFPLESLQIAGPPELISIVNRGWQGQPAIASNGERAIAFWSETGPDLEISVRSRAIEADGRPAGPIATLHGIPTVFNVAFGDGRFYAVWIAGQQVYAAVISGDGSTAGEPIALGDGANPAVAAGSDGAFAIWRSTDTGVLMGTVLLDDGSPVVPGGAPLVPAFGETQDTPFIAAIRDGYLVMWNVIGGGVRTLVLSREGGVVRGSDLDGAAQRATHLASGGNSALAMVVTPEGSRLYAFNGDGSGFELFDPRWGRWEPHSLTPFGGDRYLAVVGTDRGLFTSVVTMASGFITGISPLRRLADTYFRSPVGTVDGTPLALDLGPNGLYVATEPDRRRRIVTRR